MNQDEIRGQLYAMAAMLNSLIAQLEEPEAKTPEKPEPGTMGSQT